MGNAKYALPTRKTAKPYCFLENIFLLYKDFRCHKQVQMLPTLHFHH